MERMDDESTRLREEVAELRARLAAVDRQTLDLVSRLAHELRAPLGALLMWSHVLRGGRDSDRLAALDAIEASTRAQSRMIGALLDVCRGVAGRLRIEQEEVELATAVRTAVEPLLEVAETRRVKLSVTAAPEPVAVSGDAARLAEIVSILVDNALKFTPPEGQVDVAVVTAPATAQIVVRDTGRGIGAKAIESIFVPFRGAETGPSGAGLGVGLALARILAELHGGTLIATSPGANAGATFTLTLPRRA